MKKNLITICLSICLFQINAQNSFSKTWSSIQESNIQKSGQRQIIPQKYLTFRLNVSSLKSTLALAPNETTTPIHKSACEILLPAPNGQLQKYKVVEAPIMHPDLAAQFPDIKTYSIKGVDDIYANGKIDVTEFGFHAMVLSVNGDFFIDPYCLQNTEDYITYYTADFIKPNHLILPEAGVLENTEKPKTTQNTFPENKNQTLLSTPPAICVGTQLRTYRLAVACTGEYAVAATGSATPTVPQTLAKIVTSVNRVDGVYEKEVSVRLVLVPTETMVIFTSASTDPFSGNNNASVLIGESQSIITNTIGTANFDIGHTFSTGGGGLAGLGVVCSNSQKASGITGSPSPVGDPYDIDYVAHEMGHQFGGNHTFNSTTGSCGGGNRNAATAVEPGSGITIMAYAGICVTNDLAANSIAYFHAISYDEIVNFTNSGGGNSCAVTSTTGNNPPTVSGLASYAVPVSTPFYLTGSATDPNGDPLTYSWEETSIGTSGNWNSNVKPYFRSYTPTTTVTRYFPQQNLALSGNFTGVKGEFMPSTAQNLSFRFTARDNKMGGGGVCYANTNVNVVAGGAFSVTAPNTTGITWNTGNTETVTWNVGLTNTTPIFCDTVRILISLDGGATYSVLTNSTPNDGIESVTSPTVASTITTCRVKVEAKGNIFYDISNNNFTISNSPVGIKSNSLNQVGLSAFPNPFNNQLTIVAGNLNANFQTTLKITDVLGKIIAQFDYQNKPILNEIIETSHLNKGVYFLTVENNNKKSISKIIKE